MAEFPIIQEQYTNDNNLCYQHGHKHIAVTETFVRIFDKSRRMYNTAKNSLIQKLCQMLVMPCELLTYSSYCR